MATQSSYGQTWWGEQWLNALAKIDNDNRLPRGRTYANKGAVTKIEIGDGRIVAKVRGSRPSPYNVEIKVPAMPAGQAKVLLDALAQDPLIISKMLNRELDPAVLERAKALKIAVFPEHWRDLGMRCSCPDYAVPCKHLAAVVYVVSREIDGNPFMVFALKGVDLAKALKERDISIEREAQAALPTLAALLLPAAESTSGAEAEPAAAPKPKSRSKSKSAAAAAAAAAEAEAAPVVATPAVAPAPSAAASVAPAPLYDYAAPDYSTLPELGALLVGVLPAKPAFFQHGDFRASYDKVMKRVAKCARSALDRAAPGAAETFNADDKPRIVLDEQYRPTLTGMARDTSLRVLMQMLEQVAEADLPELQPEVAALFHARIASLHLLAHGAVLPQVFDCGKSGVGLRWLPALLDTSVAALVAQLGRLLPPGLLALKHGRAESELAGQARTLAVCGLFLDEFVADWSDAANEKPLGNKLLALFFAKGRARFDGPGEGAVAAGMQVWLARLHLGRQQHAPVLMLAEGEAGFALSLGVEAREAAGAAQEKPAPLADLLGKASWQASRYGVLQTVALLAEFFPPLNAYVSAGAAAPIALTPQALPAFLFDTLPIIRLLGIRALLPKALDRLLRPKLSMKVEAKGAATSGLLNADDLFRFDWTIAIGGAQLSPAEFEQLVARAEGVIQFKGEYVYLDPLEIAKLRAQLERPPEPDGAELLRIALAEEYAGAPVLLDANARAVIAQLTEIGQVAPPAGLNAALRPYQERGFAWLHRNLRAGFGSVIADDMGLGKTLQVIATLLKLKEEGALDAGKALVIVPTSLLTNWTREIARFAPGLTAEVFHGAARALAKGRPDVLLTTYGMARADLAKLKKLDWRVVVVDEAQNIKNPAAAQTKAVKAIPAGAFIAMSGTPVENRLSEYWSIMDFANRGMLGTLGGFDKEFAAPIQSRHDRQVAQRFQRVTAPFLLRRLKSDKSVISDLPDKIEQDQYCELSGEQSALYESVLREALRVIAGESDAFQRQGLVLQMIMALKQICNHPAQYLKLGAGEAEGGADRSGKAQLFLELLDAIHASHEKVIVFTQFREMGELLAGWIGQRFGRAPQFLHGGVARKKRDEMVERFQNDRTERVFLLSLKAGGTGLNLTAASNVIHYDLWWNPAVEAQATDRAYRIGQQRNVQVHRLITRATFEEKINEMIAAKRDLADLTVGAGEKWIGNLSNAELKDVFSLR